MTSSDDQQVVIIRDEKLRNRALDAIRSLVLGNPPWQMTIKPFVKTRTLAQNSRYWASLKLYLDEMHQTVKRIADETGYTPLEVKRLIAQGMAPEHVAILFSRKEETAHDTLKEICGVPTSTRLGTKEFMVFEERMIQTIADIAGQVQAFARMAG